MAAVASARAEMTNSRRFEPVVLCYHATSRPWDHSLSVSPETLERQVRSLLLRGYRAAPAAEISSGRGRLLHVTFDDAYSSILEALPILERLLVPATVFVCTGLADAGLPAPVSDRSGAADAAELETLGWGGLRELAERGVEVGSHTASHPHLTKVSDAELRRELQGSRDRLESELGRPCRFLAYPYGDHDARVRGTAREAGYTAAFALPGQLRRFDEFAIPRVGISRTDGAVRFLLKTSSSRRVIGRLRRWR